MTIGKIDPRYGDASATAPPSDDIERLLTDAQLYWIITVRTPYHSWASGTTARSRSVDLDRHRCDPDGRAGLRLALAGYRAGDTLIVIKLDRLAW